MHKFIEHYSMPKTWFEFARLAKKILKLYYLNIDILLIKIFNSLLIFFYLIN